MGEAYAWFFLLDVSILIQTEISTKLFDQLLDQKYKSQNNFYAYVFLF